MNSRKAVATRTFVDPMSLSRQGAGNDITECDSTKAQNQVAGDVAQSRQGPAGPCQGERLEGESRKCRESTQNSHKKEEAQGRMDRDLATFEPAAEGADHEAAKDIDKQGSIRNLARRNEALHPGTGRKTTDRPDKTTKTHPQPLRQETLRII